YEVQQRSSRSWPLYFTPSVTRINNSTTTHINLLLSTSDSTSILRSLRPPTAPSRDQTPFLPILSSALAQHGRSARKFALDAPKQCPTLYPRPRSRPPRKTSRSPPRESSLWGACI